MKKIALLKESKVMIHRARADYERKLRRVFTEDVFVERFPKQVIRLSDTMETPTVDNLWNYLSHFYGKVGKECRDLFEFEDAAGIYTENGRSRLLPYALNTIKLMGLQHFRKGIISVRTVPNRKERIS